MRRGGRGGGVEEGPGGGWKGQNDKAALNWFEREEPMVSHLQLLRFANGFAFNECIQWTIKRELIKSALQNH